jgi:putative membrane protein
MKDEYKGIRGFFRRRQHPVKIIMYIAKYLWLLLIPLAKYLIATQFDFESWVKTNWVDILTLSVIFGYGILRWVFIYFEIEEDSIIAHTGYFGIERTQVYFS